MLNTVSFSGLSLFYSHPFYDDLEPESSTNKSPRIGVVVMPNGLSNIANDEIQFNGRTLGHCPKVAEISTRTVETADEEQRLREDLGDIIYGDGPEGELITFSKTSPINDYNGQLLMSLRSTFLMLRNQMSGFSPTLNHAPLTSGVFAGQGYAFTTTPSASSEETSELDFQPDGKQHQVPIDTFS